jgi:hypothetical protein
VIEWVDTYFESTGGSSPPSKYNVLQSQNTLVPAGFLHAPDGLPNNHPGLDQYFVPEETPYGEFPIVYWDHLDIHESYSQGEPLPQGHPSVMDLV